MKTRTERREYRRVHKIIGINILNCQFNGTYLRFDKNANHPKFYDEVATDFSPGGLRVLCSKELPQNSKIKMKLMIPDAQKFVFLELNGRIVWVKETKTRYKKAFWFGVQFKDLSKKSRDQIRYLWKKYSSLSARKVDRRRAL